MKNIIFNVYYISKKFGRPNKKDGVTFLVKKNTRRKEWRKEKEEILTAMEVPILCVFSIGWECPSPTTSKIVLVQCRLAFLHLWQR
jgi:hypothetical protein